MARCLRFQANLPISFWGEFILTTTYLINRTPSPSLKHKPPYELLLKKPLSCTHIRVFGCLCYAQTPRQYRDKFSSRSSRCVFLGYLANHKAYRVYDLENHKLFISRDVTFKEHNFPYHLIPPTPATTLVLLFTIPDIPSSSNLPTSSPSSSIHPPSPLTSPSPPLPPQDPISRSKRVATCPPYLND